jgi:DNA invertase Pin-like site-specific DNA recombinase
MSKAQTRRGASQPSRPQRKEGRAMTTRKNAAKAALYLRVSTDDQSTDNQERELREAAEAKGFEVAKVYRDEGISGAKGRDKRPGLHAALQDATRGRFGVLMAWSVDRLGRSLTDLLATLHELHAAGVDLYLHKQALDTRTPAGRAMFQLLGVFAEFERSMIQARVKSGVTRAREAGVVFGRPRVSPELEQQIRELRTQGVGIGTVARRLGVGVSVVQRVEREAKAASGE